MFEEWKTTSAILQQLGGSGADPRWRQLVESFREPMLANARRARLGEADAEDAVQEALLTFSEAYKAGRYERGRGRLRDWLFGILHKKCMEAQRRAQRDRLHGAVSQFTSELELERAPSAAEREQWEQDWERSLYARCLKRVRHEFEPGTFEAFRLVALEGLAAEEVARRLQLERDSVYKAKYRVAKRLAEFVREYEDC
jgi:RNA polymerase sigma-70 factor (ECF subfamily)